MQTHHAAAVRPLPLLIFDKEKFMTGFAPLFNATRSALAGEGAQTIVRFNAASRGNDGLHRRVKIRGFAVEVDEPESLGGTDRAPSPVEYALAALATCQEITYRLHADSLGIALKDVSVELEGELDLRGFFGAVEGVRPGFLNINGSVRFDSSAPAADLERLKSVVDAHCPVLDLFNNATPVQIRIADPIAPVARVAEVADAV